MTPSAAAPDRGDQDVAGVVRYGPAVDRWILAVLVVSGVAMLAATIAVALDPDAGLGVLLLTIAIDLFTVGAIVLLAVPIVYELDLTELRVRAGVTRTAMALADVVRVEIAFSPLSNTTAAWTLRRVRLTDARGRTLEVGPPDRLGFVAEVLARAPQLVAEPGRDRVWVDPARTRRRRPPG